MSSSWVWSTIPSIRSRLDSKMQLFCCGSPHACCYFCFLQGMARRCWNSQRFFVNSWWSPWILNPQDQWSEFLSACGLNNCGCKRIAKDKQRVFPSLLCLLWALHGGFGAGGNPCYGAWHKCCGCRNGTGQSRLYLVFIVACVSREVPTAKPPPCTALKFGNLQFHWQLGLCSEFALVAEAGVARAGPPPAGGAMAVWASVMPVGLTQKICCALISMTFACSHSWCWWSMFCEYCIRAWIVLHDVHLEVQPDLCTPGVSSLIQHSSDDKCSSVMQNVITHPYFLLHRSLQICFWLSPDSMPKFAQVFPILCPLLLSLQVSSLLEA